MSALLWIALLLQAGNARSDVWKGVDLSPTRGQTRDIQLSAAQEGAIETALKKNNHAWECAATDPTGKWVEGLRFSSIPLSHEQQTILVEAGPGCARGGQGANGAMWVMQLKGDQVIVLASPQQGFGGWLYAVQPSSNQGYKDIVVGWHMSAREAGLSYFRFEGTQYKKLSSAEIRWDDSGNATIAPNEKAQR